ncbi:MAG: energy-coupling factor ABC transporter substrate-binding protein [Magnetococcales bacterium]|nr:energy-coupling factor ABC transporter substrate-binding protein [Magnetococcales bacterium]
MLRDNRIVLGLAVLIVLLPLVVPLPSTQNAAFGGADDQAGNVILELRPGYTPWFEPLWEPPSGEIGSLLFALQAAIGSGVVAYYFGLRRGRRERSERTNARV